MSSGVNEIGDSLRESEHIQNNYPFTPSDADATQLDRRDDRYRSGGENWLTYVGERCGICARAQRKANAPFYIAVVDSYSSSSTTGNMADRGATRAEIFLRLTNS